MERNVQKIMMGVYLLDLFADENKGREPETIWQYRRLGRRFGYRLRFVSDAVYEAFARRGQRADGGGVIYIRRRHNMALTRLEILHELGEAAGRWEGVSPCVCQVTRHEAAVAAVEIKRARM